jgi:hypothetical protein
MPVKAKTKTTATPRKQKEGFMLKPEYIFGGVLGAIVGATLGTTILAMFNHKSTKEKAVELLGEVIDKGIKSLQEAGGETTKAVGKGIDTLEKRYLHA